MDPQSQETATTSSEVSSQAVSQPAQVEAPAASEATETSTEGQDSLDQAAATQATPPAYTPNLKYKVRDKEYEIDAFMKDVIKDADTEKKIRELYEKAQGVDQVFRPKIQEVSGQLSDVTGKFNGVVSQLQEINKEIIERGDLDSLIEAFKVPMDTVKQWMLKKLQQEELPPEQRQVYDQERQQRARLRQLEQQNQQYESQLAERATSERVRDLQSALARPDVKSMVDAYDAKFQRPGAFFEQVVKHAQWTWATQQKDLPAEEAIREVMALWSQVLPQQTAQSPAAPPAQSPAAPAQNLPVIPTVAGRNASPTKRVPKNIADLKKIRAEIEAAN